MFVVVASFILLGAPVSAQTPINPCDTLPGVIAGPSYLQDWVFEGNAGDRVLISAVKTEGNLNTGIYLYPPDGGPPEAGSYWGYEDTIDHQLEQSGTYTIIVQDYGLNDGGNYMLTLIKIPGPACDGEILSGETHSSEIEAASDRDAFQFFGETGDRVLISAVKTGGTLDTGIHLYPPGGGAREAGSYWGYEDALDHQLQQSGLYTIIIEDYGLYDTGTYNITLIKIPGEPASAADPDGGPIASGQTLSGQMNMASDRDAFQFFGETGDRVLIAAVKTDGTLDTGVHLYPPGGGAREAGSYWGYEDSLDHQLQQTGLYTIIIEDYGLYDAGTYNITLAKMPGAVSSPEDPDGGLLSSGQTLSGQTTASDRDLFHLYGQAGDRVLIAAVATGGGLNTGVYLYPPGGGPVEAGSYWGYEDTIDHQLEQSGLYTVVVQDYGLDASGTYNVSLTKIPSTERPGIYDSSPGNGSVVCPVDSVTLEWRAVSGATGYDVYFGEDVIEPLALIGSDIPSNNLTVSDLTPGSVYYWHVVAHTASGDVQGMWLWFVTCGELTAINLVAPPDQSIIVAAPTFEWFADGGVDNAYAVDASLSPAFSKYWSTYENLHQLIRQTTWTMPGPVWNMIPSGTDVYWRVRGVDLDERPLTIIVSEETWSFHKP